MALLDNQASDEEEDDVDDLGNADVPLLDGQLIDDEAPSMTKKHAIGFSRFFSKGRRTKGVCPLCQQVVTSGAHVCSFTEWKVHQGKRSEAVRCDGNIHFRAKRYESAVAAYTEALEHTPDDAKLWSNRAAAQMLLGQHEESLLDSKAAIRLTPSWAKGYFRKALVLRARADWDAAIKTYEQVLSNCPKSEEQAKARKCLAAVRAQKLLDERIQALPQPFSESLVRTRWQDMLDNGAERLTDIMDSFECSRRLQEAETAKADGNVEVGKRAWEAARECYERGLALLRYCAAEPSEEQARVEAALMLNLALCEAHCHRHTSAAKLCTVVLQLNPRCVKARFRLATALSEMHDYDTAAEEAQIALALQPHEPAVQALRQRLQEKRQTLRRRQKAQFARLFSSES